MRPANPSGIRYAVSACAALALTVAANAGEPGKMTREVWNNINGSSIPAFTGNTRYWQPADSVSTYTGAAAPQNIGNNYGSRVRAYLTAPATGDYIFWIAADDDSELYLSPGESKFGRVKIASNVGWVNPQEWDARATQKSALIHLEAGQKVFIEALHKEGSGGDHLAIAWQVPGGIRALIPGSALESFNSDPNDIDNDELPDDWELAHSFSVSDDGTLYPDQHPLADPDHDGVSNLVEAQNGSDPHVPSGLPGRMTREVWNNISGSSLNAFTDSGRFWQAADSVSTFAGSAAPQNTGDNYAARIRAYLTAPVSGDYTFWIASDDDSALYLSTSDSKLAGVKIASVAGYVDPQAWDSKTSQKSALITLVAGQRYFMEALHKEGGGGDHLEIAWQTPDGSREPIPAAALESFAVDANDRDNDGLPDDWETANGLSLAAKDGAADPDHDGYSNLEEFQFGTNPGIRGGIPGSLLLETWNWIGGGRVGSLTHSTQYAGPPDKSEFVFAAETPVNRATYYGTRMSGFIIAPATGDYTFYVSGDDTCELWLSPGESQFEKQKIASSDAWTNVRQWDKYPAQHSATIPLVAGRKYYMEGLLKQSNGGDHLEIGWKTPGSATIAVIPGSALESYAYDANDADGDHMPDDWEAAHGLDPAVNDAASDPDLDGVPNSLEFTVGTDPQVKSTVAGALVQELWTDIPGYYVKDLTSSPRFLQAADTLSLVTSTETEDQRHDSFGSRLRGYLTAPVTGTYTFWVLGDDQSEFWLSTSSSQFDKEMLVRPNVNAGSFDTDLSQKSRAVALVAGQRYYLEILHKDYYNSDYSQVAWTTPVGNREIIPGTFLSSFTPTADDRDDDGLPDAWETANGLSPDDNGHINPKNGAQGDLDGDGLSNAAEWKAGTRANLTDTDGDGVNDREEIDILETQALVSDVQAFESVAVLAGDAYGESSPGWTRQNGKASQECIRGWLDYPVTLGAAGQYAAEFEFTAVSGGESFPDYEIVFSVDDHAVGRQTATAAATASGRARILLPWLGAGNHTLRVYVDNSVQARRISADRLTVLAARGTDTNDNQVPDWVDERLTRSNTVEAPAESLTSPVCIEGRAKWSGLALVAGSPVVPAPDDRWFANVNLDPAQPVTIDASLENGAVTTSRQIIWSPTNLLSTDALSLRQGDSLRLSAWQGDTPAEEESLTISVEGSTVATDATRPVIHTFTTAGTIPVQVTHILDGVPTVRTATVRVLAAPPVMEAPVCVVGFFRDVSVPALPEGVSFQADTRIETRGSTPGASGGSVRTLRLTSLQDRTGVFRAGGVTGPILGAVAFKAMRIRSGRETALYYSEDLGNSSYEITSPVIVDGLNPGIELRYDIFIGGVVFDDGTRHKTILVPDDLVLPPTLENTGDYTLKFLKSSFSGSNCHRVTVIQSGKQIAVFQ